MTVLKMFKKTRRVYEKFKVNTETLAERGNGYTQVSRGKEAKHGKEQFRTTGGKQLRTADNHYILDEAVCGDDSEEVDSENDTSVSDLIDDNREQREESSENESSDQKQTRIKAFVVSNKKEEEEEEEEDSDSSDDEGSGDKKDENDKEVEEKENDEN